MTSLLPSPPRSNYCHTEISEENVFVVTLNEATDDYGRLFLELNGKGYESPISSDEYLQKDQIYFFDFENLTPDAHPMHLHQVMFDVCGRQDLGDPNSTWSSPLGYERGPKDTVECPANQRTRVATKFEFVGKTVCHCHILEHEDYAMMRTLMIVDPQQEFLVGNNKTSFFEQIN